MPLVEILIVLALVLLNGYFAMSELAVVSARPARLEALAGKGSRGARLALALARDPGRMLSTVQIGITLVGIIAGAFGGATLAEPLDNALARLPGLAPVSAEIAYTLVVLAITYLSLIVGELVPKHLALRAPERIASLVAPVIDLLSRISTPPVWLLEKSSLFVLRLLGSEVQPRETVTEEEVRTLIAEGTRTGVFHKQEQEMIIRVLRLADRPVRAIMTPRVELVWLDVEDDPAEIARVIKESGHGRFVIGKAASMRYSGSFMCAVCWMPPRGPHAGSARRRAPGLGRARQHAGAAGAGSAPPGAGQHGAGGRRVWRGGGRGHGRGRA